MVNQTYSKILKCFIIFCPRLCETFSFCLYIFGNDSSLKIAKFLLIKKNSTGKTPATEIKMFQIILFNLNHTWKKGLQKSAKLRTLAQCAYIMFTIKISGSIWTMKRSKYWSLQETGTSYKNNFITQTMPDKIYETMSRNQAKLDRTRKLCYLFFRNF